MSDTTQAPCSTPSDVKGAGREPWPARLGAHIDQKVGTGQDEVAGLRYIRRSYNS